MSYCLSINRPPKHPGDFCDPIEFDEWIDAVNEVNGVRFVGSDSDDANEEYAEVFFAEKPGCGIDGVWETIFEYRDDGYIEFRGSSDYRPDHPVWIAAAALAKKLQAQIRGQDGESYDLDTAEPQD